MTDVDKAKVLAQGEKVLEEMKQSQDKQREALVAALAVAEQQVREFKAAIASLDGTKAPRANSSPTTARAVKPDDAASVIDALEAADSNGLTIDELVERVSFSKPKLTYVVKSLLSDGRIVTIGTSKRPYFYGVASA